MCLAVPMKITEIYPDGMAKCRIGEGDTFITASVALLSAPPDVGDYVIVHAGFAMHRLEAEEAQKTLSLLREMVALADTSQTDL